MIASAAIGWLRRSGIIPVQGFSGQDLSTLHRKKKKTMNLSFMILRVALKTLDDETIRLTLDIPMEEMDAVAMLLVGYAQSLALDSEIDDSVQWEPIASA